MPRELLPDFPCDGKVANPLTPGGPKEPCTNRVASRKPSKSGLHFCQRPECQASKQRAYRDLRRAPDPTVESLRLELVGAALHGTRSPCHACGLEDAIPGWAHRSAPGSSEPCLAMGNKGGAVGIAWVDAVWPGRAGT